jgi:4-amino-4-deoxychorismate lyase
VESPLRAGAGAEGLKLIETMLWNGAYVPRLALHLARLTAGAAALGWGVPDVAVRLMAVRTVGSARLRLTLDARGAVEITTSPVPPAKPVWQVGLAPERLTSDDPWLGIKSTRRGAYDRARAHLPPGLDEVVLVNERGEVCDGTITTVFFDRGSGMLTPPLTSGVLPGVLRAEMGCPEQVLLAADLGQVRLWVGNSLRGLIAARFVA